MTKITNSDGVEFTQDSAEIEQAILEERFDDASQMYEERVEPVGEDKAKSWSPYVGPQEGFGWTDGNEVVYQEEPPGEVDLSGLSDGEIEELKEELADQGVELEITGSMSIPSDLDLSSSERERISATLDSALEVHDVDIDGVISETETLSVAYYEPNDKTIHLNPHEFNSQNVNEWAENGHIAYDSLEGIVAHEVVHAIQWQSVGDASIAAVKDWQSDEHQEIAKEISEYAAENPQEFVAEIGALKMLGEDIPEEAEYLYDGYLGPDVEVLDI